MNRDLFNNIKNIAIIVDRDLDYYKNLKTFLDSYNQPLSPDSFINNAIEKNSTDKGVASHYNNIVLYGSYPGSSWSGLANVSSRTREYHLYRHADELNAIFSGKISSDKLTINEIKELKKTIWIKLNSEQEIKNAYDLLVKYNQIIYKDKDGIPLLIGTDHMSEGFLGMNSKNQPQFGVWSNSIHNATHTEEIKIKYNFIIDNLELLEHLFKQEEELLNK